MLDVNGKLVASDHPRMAQLVRNLNMMVPRVKAVGDRYGFNPCRTYFAIKSDEQLLDDLIYPLGSPVSRYAWWYGKEAYQQRRSGYGGHVFEFANISEPAHVVLGESNDLMMHILVIIHAWMGHVHVFTNNFWHRETEQKTALQRMAQDAEFVKTLVEDPQYGWDKYEYYADAAHALQLHSGDLPTNPDAVTDEELREEIKQRIESLKAKFDLAMVDSDQKAIAEEIRDAMRLLSCHPITPTTDILGFLLTPDNTKSLTDKERRIIEMTRFENRYSWQVLGRTKILHEGISHWQDRRMPLEPELDIIRLGYQHLFDNGRYDTMHDSWPIYWYSDPYALGEALVDYASTKLRKRIGTETVTFNRLKMQENGDLEETDEVVTREVEKWDNSAFVNMIDTFDDMRLFITYLTEEFYEQLHKKALGWVKKMIMSINKILKDLHWDPALIFEDEREPQTLEEMHEVISMWLNQHSVAQWIKWWGYGAPPFPVSQTSLWQMLQIVETVAAYDEDKVEFKRQMLLRTGMFWVPNIKLVDTGRENKASMATLRHEYDNDFGPLAQNDARQTLRHLWRFIGPVRLLTMEILTDAYGRPWGPPRPFQYHTDNGETVKERWL